MIRNLIATLFILSCAVFAATAQEIGLRGTKADNGFFNHLDLSATVGTSGIGVDFSTPVGQYFRVRAGVSYMPQIEMSSGFRVQVGDSLEKKFDAAGNRVQTKFDKLSGMLKGLTGFEVNDEISMQLKPTFYNVRFIVDAYPFASKRWHISAGFFVGNSTLGRAYNSAEDMPSLVAVVMYNQLFDKLQSNEPIFTIGGKPFQIPLDDRDAMLAKLESYGRMGVHVGNYVKDGPVIYNEWGEPELDDEGNEMRLYHKGDPYMMVPGKDGMVKVKAKSHRFKPYVGFGYSGPISKDGLTELSVEAGVLFWGGKPNVYTHDGTDLIYDVENVRGKVGSYTRFIKHFPVFPLLELRLSRRIF